MTEAEVWLICILVGAAIAIPANVLWYLIERLLYRDPTAPRCHVVSCKGVVLHAHWATDEPYDVQYFCPRHTGELMLPCKFYRVEPWKTELSDLQISKLIRSLR